MRKNLTIVAILAVMLSAIGCATKSSLPVAELLTKAEESGKAVLLVIGDASTRGEKIIEMAQLATKGMDGVEIIAMNRDDQANAELVSSLRISDIPLPVMMVFTDRGVPVSGLMESEITVDIIKNIIPSKGFSDISYYISGGKSVIINITKEGFASDGAARELCSAAVADLSGEAETVVINADGEGEATLFELLDINEKPGDALIIVINKEGLGAGRFETLPSKEEIIEAAQKSFYQNMQEHEHVHTEDCNH